MLIQRQKLKNYFVDKSWIIHFKLKDNNLKKFLEEKGSISINGVSLTISKVEKSILN